MEEAPDRGSLAQTPFAHVLAGIWRAERSGILTVHTPGGPKEFAFDGGALTVSRALFREKDFLQFLMTAGAADLISLARCEEFAQDRGLTLVRALVEAPLFEAGRLWPLIGDFARGEAFALFDAEGLEFEFATGPAPGGPAYIRTIFLPDLIMDGVRKMTNDALIARHLPPESESVQALSPALLDKLTLAPHERYLLDLLAAAKSPAELCAASDLGERESRRILFAFLALGIAGTGAPRPKTTKLAAELSLGDMDKLLGVLNAKCAYVYKYISKEIGPVALSVVGKSLEDIRARLDPVFQEFELKPDGRVELRSFLKMNMNLAGDEGKRSLLRSMDEILVAEVLAVKRTLGAAHEAALVKGLEKIGETP